MMMNPSAVAQAEHSRAWTLGFVAALYLAWIAAWLLELSLSRPFGWLASDPGSFIYWTLMKVLVWILPATFVIHQTGRRVRDVLAFDRWRAALPWGIGAGLVLGAVSLATHAFGHQPLLAPEVSWAFVSAVIVAPIVEEYTFRGAVLGGLSRRYRFLIANSLTALFFLGAHLPGWYFQGQLPTLLLAPVGGALSIFLLGWVFGLVSQRSGTILGSILAHMLNNFFAS